MRYHGHDRSRVVALVRLSMAVLLLVATGGVGVWAAPVPDPLAASQASAVSSDNPLAMPAPIPQRAPTVVAKQALVHVLSPEATATAQATLDALWQQLDVAWNAQDWALVLSIIAQIKAIDPNYLTVEDKEYFAHVNYGFELMPQGQCTLAEQHFQAALAIRPTGEEALTGMGLLPVYCATPVPTATPGVVTPTTGPTPTITPVTPIPATAVPPAAGCGPISSTITYTVQPGDTLYSLANCYQTTIQDIMQANGMNTYFLMAGDTIWIPGASAMGGPIVHIVQPCETLASIAAQYNTTVWAIQMMNGLYGTTIYAYQALFIPTALNSGPIIHIVQAGETLFTIAQKYGTTVSLLMLANGFNTYDLYVFQRVVIPPPDWTGFPSLDFYLYPDPGPAPGPWSPMPGPIYYTVKPGDTLWGIAVAHGTTVSQLRAANGISGSWIYVGQVLRIP